jgi:ABC-type multidrug transport system ATPase subunit
VGQIADRAVAGRGVHVGALDPALGERGALLRGQKVDLHPRRKDHEVADAERNQVEDADLEAVARLGAADRDRSGDRRDAAKIHGRVQPPVQVLGGRRRVELAVEALAAVHPDDLARQDLEDRLEVGLPSGVHPLRPQDEPTAILSAAEKQWLFAVLAELRRDGLCIVFITHFIEELFAVCDRVTVMRDGRTVATFEIADTSRDEVVFAMVGAVTGSARDLGSTEEGRRPVLAIRGGASGRAFAGVDLSVGEGEVLGLAGLIGSGCYEVAEGLFGVRALDAGEIRLDDRPARLRSPRAAVRAGIGYVPEDRRRLGLCLNLRASTNVALPSLAERRFSWNGLVKQKVVRDAFARIGRTLRLQPLDPSLEAAAFSGGNQQKLVIGKWIERGCRAYVLVQPTRGVDVGAKVEIWRIIEQLGRDGAAVVLVSTDFDDIAAVCTRCLVFAEGRIAGELVRPEVSAENIAAATVAGARAGPRRPLSLA